MYVRTPSSSGSRSSGAVSNAPSTPSQAPRSLHRERDFPPTPRSPNTPLTPGSPGTAISYAPYAPSQYGSNHNIAYGLMTPPGSPEKVARRQPDFHPMLDASLQPIAFDVRIGAMLHPQAQSAPAINHPVTRMVIFVGGLFTAEIAARGIPTIGELSGQLAGASARNAAALGKRYLSAGLTLRSVEGGVAICDLHLRSA